MMRSADSVSLDSAGGRQDTPSDRWPAIYFLVSALIPGHLLNWGVEWAFAGLTAVAGAILYPRFHRRYPSVSAIGLSVISLVAALSTGSYAFTVATGRFATGPRDWIDLLRPFLAYFSCTLAFSFGPVRLRSIQRAATYVLSFTVLVASILIFNVPILRSVANFLYSDTKTAISATLLRISIPFENPNFLGLFAVAAFCLAVLFGSRPRYLLAAVALVTIGLTGSRTAWLTTAMIVVAKLMLNGARVLRPRRQIRRGGRMLRATLALGLVVVAAFYLPEIVQANQRFIDFAEGLAHLDLLRDPSYQERQAMRAQAGRLIEERLVLGWGALKQSDIEIVDNQYISLLLRCGLLGTFVIVLALGGLFVRHVVNGAKRLRAMEVVVLWVVVLAWMWSGSFAENVRLSVLVVLMFAASVSRYDESFT